MHRQQLDIEAVKQRADIRQVMEHWGLVLKRTGPDQFMATCPFHDDKTPSLSVTPSKGLWHCFGCEISGDVIDFIQRIERVDFPQALARAAEFAGIPSLVAPATSATSTTSRPRPNGSAKQAKHSRVVATYPYVNEHGDLQYEVLRLAPKSFRVRRRDGSGGWVWNLGDTPRILFRLPQVLAADTVYVLEGERDVLTLEAAGVVATTASGGASQPWLPRYTAALSGKRVIVIPDADEVGRKRGNRIVEALKGNAREVTLIELPTGFKDVSEYCEAGFGIDDLRKLIDAAASAPTAATISPAPGPDRDISDKRGLISLKSLMSQVQSWPKPLAEEAYHGLAGEIVRTIEPHTEADPAALLVQLLVAFGSAVGRGPYFSVEADRHHANLFCCLVGETSKARKGTSVSHVRRVFRAVDDEWEASRITSGLSSGEGLIWHVRDAIEVYDPKEEEYVVKDPGIEDKRSLVIESEFSRVLKACERQGNTLSDVIRQAWDGDTLRILTRTTAASSKDAHISIVGHITVGELIRLLTDIQAGNGFANRFLWICARRSKELPEGGDLRDEDLETLTRRLCGAIEKSRSIGEVRRDESARSIWRKVYSGLSQGQPGLFGSVTSRAEAQTMRLALIYALLDSSPVIRGEHLMAALAVWTYTESSARFIFGDSLGDPAADKIMVLLRGRTDGMTRNDIVRCFGGHRGKDQLDRALDLLLRLGRVKRETVETGGRPAETWFAVAT